MITLVETALHYAHAFGWAVHPVDIKKQPTTKHGRNDATRDDPTIRAFFRNGAQIGVATGPESNLFVLDVDLDEKRGINGYETLEYLETIHGKLPPTPHQRTGRGGTQYLFNYVEGLKNSTSKIGAGIDTRGRGGYVVVAPSRNTNGPYQWIVSPEEAPLADVPQWLIDLLAEAEAAQTTTAASSGNERTYCLKMLGQAVARVATANDGQKHETLLKMATWMGGFAPTISETEIESALFAAIELRAEDHAGARKTIQDGIAYGKTKPLAVPAQSEDPDPVLVAGEIITQVPSAPALVAPRYQLYKLSGLRALPPVEWLIDGEIPAALTTIICGPSGAGKSFLMVDYAMRVARRYPDRIVVYIAPEGGTGYHLRTQAWLEHFGGAEPDNLLFILQAIPLLTPQAVSDLITIIRPFRPVMLIVDTLARCLVGGDENSAKDVGLFFYHTDQIRQETGAAISIVHHTGKSGGGYRGSSVLYGSVESWIDVMNDDGLITVSCGKSKDSKPFPPRYLRMMEVGDSVVLLPADQVSGRDAGLTDPQRKILETLALDIFTSAGAKRSELVSATGMPEPTMYKVLSRLKRSGNISQGKRGDPYYITDSGMDLIRSYHRDLKHQREKLSNYPETINELSASLPPPTINYHNYPPSLEGDSIDSFVGRTGDDSDLFSDDNATVQKTEPPITDLIARLKNKGARVLSDAEVKEVFTRDNPDTTFSKFTGVPVEEQDDATERQEPTDE